MGHFDRPLPLRSADRWMPFEVVISNNTRNDHFDRPITHMFRETGIWSHLISGPFRYLSDVVRGDKSTVRVSEVLAVGIS